jgi:hypothetical protein
MSGDASYSIKDIKELISSMADVKYFMLMSEDNVVTEAFIKAVITSITGKDVVGDWRGFFEEVSTEEFANESRLLNNAILIPAILDNQPLRKGFIIGKNPFVFITINEPNIVGFVIEGSGDYETHYLMFDGFDINTQENRKVLIKTRALSNGGAFYRVSSTT